MLFVFSVITICVLVVGFWTYSSTTKAATRLRGTFNRKKEELSNNIGNSMDGHNQVVSETKSNINAHRERLIELIAANKDFQAKHKEQVEAVERYGQLANKALELGNEDAAREALEKQVQAEKLAETYCSTVEENEKFIDETRAELERAEGKVRDAEMQGQILGVRQSSVEMRKKMMASSGFGGAGNLTATLDSYAQEIAHEERKLEARDELNGGSSSLAKMERELSTNSAVEDRLAALKAKQKV